MTYLWKLLKRWICIYIVCLSLQHYYQSSSLISDSNWEYFIKTEVNV